MDLTYITSRFRNILRLVGEPAMSNNEILENEINTWLKSKIRHDQIMGKRYYEGDQKILTRQREIIGEGGTLEPVFNLPNARLVNNLYALHVDKKANYALGKPFSYECDNDDYLKELKLIFNKSFQKVLYTCMLESLNCGLAWIYPYYDNNKLEFAVFPAYEILPFWTDSQQNKLHFAVRYYETSEYVGKSEKIIRHVDIYTTDGLEKCVLDDQFKLSSIRKDSFITKGVENFNWDRIPLIPFRYNNKCIPLLNRVKSLQDCYNEIISDFSNNMQENNRNTILVLENYDGENLATFRKNLAQLGAIKVGRMDGNGGDVRTLQVEVNSGNYELILNVVKKAIVENARSYDFSDSRSSQNANQLNIRSIFSDVDLDANGTEIEYQASLEDLLWFINQYIKEIKGKDFDGEEVRFIFNRDLPISETDIINNCVASLSVLSKESIVAQHPWTTSVDLELERLKKEEQEALDYQNAFIESGVENEQPSGRDL